MCKLNHPGDAEHIAAEVLREQAAKLIREAEKLEAKALAEWAKAAVNADQQT
jgi:hypothetical protein